MSIDVEPIAESAHPDALQAASKRLYVYIDETRGQDPPFFIVAALLVRGHHKERLEEDLSKLERLVEKSSWRKWHGMKNDQRVTYIRRIVELKRRFAANFGICYRVSNDNIKAHEKTGEAVAAAIRSYNPDPDVPITVVVDGLNKAERQNLSRQLRGLGLQHSLTIRGGRDQSTSLLRLADCAAGFAGHAYKQKQPLLDLWRDTGALLFLQV